MKVLGLIIDEDLSFNKMIAAIKSKILPMAFAIRRIRHRISDKIAHDLYFAYIYSHLIYLNPLWCCANNTEIQKLFIVQKKTLKIINNKSRLTRSSELFTEMVLPLPALNEYLLLILAFKLKFNLIKNEVEIKKINDIHQRNTRRGTDFYVQPYKTKFGLADFFCRGLLKFNELPDDMRKFKTLIIFKKRLREYVFENFVAES